MIPLLLVWKILVEKTDDSGSRPAGRCRDNLPVQNDGNVWNGVRLKNKLQKVNLI